MVEVGEKVIAEDEEHCPRDASQEIYRRQLPFGRLDGKIVPLIANPLASNSVFVADCKYWTREITDLYHYDKEIKDSYGQPFEI